MLDYVKIEGYEERFHHRKDKRGGGVGIYVRECYDFKLRKDIMNIEPEIEHLWIELTYRNKNSSVLIESCYQDNFNNVGKAVWLNKMDNVIAQLAAKWDSTIILCGDLNIDCVKTVCPSYKLYYEILNAHNLKQHINQPTRNEAILDHIISNIPNKIRHSGVIPCPEISDHDCA